MKIAVFETEEWEHDACLRLRSRHDLVCTDQPLDKVTAKSFANAEVVSPFVNSTLSAKVLSLFPRVKLVATRSTGYDHIDLDYCRAHGITVSNVPDYGDSTVAEHVFALLLSVARNLVDAVERTRRGKFTQSGLRGFELHGKTLGVVGTGRIGRRVIEIARGFAMPVVACDLRPNDGEARRLDFRYAGLDDVLRAADIVTLHVPSMAETVGMISDREFGLMKQGAVLINTARGSIVDVPALVRALASGKLRAAGLDVLPDEPVIREEAAMFRHQGASEGYDLKALVANHVLLRFPNVLVTPHNAYNTDDALRRIIQTSVENMEAFANRHPQNVVVGG